MQEKPSLTNLVQPGQEQGLADIQIARLRISWTEEENKNFDHAVDVLYRILCKYRKGEE